MTLTLDELLAPSVYARVRGQRRAALIRHKAARRVAIGEHLSLLFESRATVLAQTQEIVHVEGRDTAALMQREIDEYACLLPSPSRLTATLTLHSGPIELCAALQTELHGDHGPLALETSTSRSTCFALQPRTSIAEAVHYLGFAIDATFVTALCSSTPAWLRLRSAIGNHDVPLPPALQSALLDTLAPPSCTGHALAV